ncbi:MAG: polyprenyl synthetase family protein [Candidatus Hydrogenedentes bacterium]|nr:polyprenyl synthetase family protein [Candidatus Hydrogenedentota bacterium]
MPHIALAEYLEQRRALVDRALDSRLPDTDTPPQRVHDAMRYAALSAGKRLRPVLVLAVSDLAGTPLERVMDAACAVEFVHAASLVLDDLPSMDNAILRRECPCTHIKYGEATAILAAMGLIALAFDLVAHNAEMFGCGGAASPAVRHLAHAVGTGGLVAGQHADLDLTDRAVSLDELEYTHHQKAGALFLASVQVPAYLVGLPPDEIQVLESYARYMGLAFQITDDVLDSHCDHEDVGKSTFASHLGVEGARSKVADLIAAATSVLEPFGDRAETLRDLAEHVRTRTA